jgi:transposase
LSQHARRARRALEDDAMAEDGRFRGFGEDSIEGRLREQIREVIEKLLEGELDEALGGPDV